MTKIPLFLVLLILLPTAYGWTQTNLNDFVTYAYAKTSCHNETLDISKILLEENATTPDFTKLKVYENAPYCENLVRAGYHYFQLNDPQPSCPRFYDRIHEWFGLWNWKFTDCGIVFTKADLDTLLLQYQTDFFTGELTVTTQPHKYQPLTEYNYTESNQTQPKNNIGGGGGGMPNIGKNSVWENWLGIPNWAIIEIILLIVSWFITGVVWGWRSSEVTDFYVYGKSRSKNIVKSGAGKLKMLFGIFLILNIVWWVFFAII